MADQTVTKYVRVVGQVEGLEEFRKAADEFNKLNVSAAGMASGITASNAAVNSASQSMTGWTKSLKAQEAAMSILPSKIAVIKTELNSMAAAGDTSSNRFRIMTAELVRLTAASNQFGVATNGNVNTLRRNRQQLQNVSYQLTDMVVQLQGGTSLTTAFAQQVPQILAGFGAFGALAGLVVSLAASIGGPLLASMFKTNAKVKEFSENNELLLGSLKGIETIGKSLDMKGAIESFNSLDKLSKTLAVNLLEARLQLSALKSDATMAQLRDEVDGVGKALFGMVGSIKDFSAELNIGSKLGLDVDSGDKVLDTLRKLNSGAIDAAKATEELNKVNKAGNATYQALRLRISEAAVATVEQANATKDLTDLRERMTKALETGAKLEVPATKAELSKATRDLARAEEERVKTLGALQLEYLKLLGPMNAYDELLIKQQLGLEKIDPLIDAQVKKLTQLIVTQKDLNNIEKLRLAAQKELDEQAQKTKDNIDKMLAKREDELRSLVDTYDTTGASLRKLAEDAAQLRKEFENGFITDEQFAAAMAGLQKAVDATFSDQNKKKIDDFDKAMQQLSIDGIGGLIDVLFEADQTFAQFAGNFLREMAKMIAKQAIFNALKSTPFGNFLGLTAADGKAFTGGTSLAQGVYTSPQLFKFAKGGMFNTGLMAEAGPEAVMPLSRNSSGELGVKADIRVTVNNNAGAEVSVQQTGDNNIEITIDRVKRALTQDVAAGGNSFSNALQQTYGLNRGAR